jgi:protein SCO1/2
MNLRVLVAAALAVAAAGVAVGLVLARGSDSSNDSFAGGTPPPGITLPAFDLPDVDGTALSSSDLRGKVALVTFLDSQCTDACPIVASTLADGLSLLEPDEREQVVALAISTDPDEDTPEAVHAFLRPQGADGVIRYLVAPVDVLRPLWTKFAVATTFDSGDDSLHSAPVRIFDTAGEWVSTLNAGADLTPENVAHDVRAALQNA